MIGRIGEFVQFNYFHTIPNEPSSFIADRGTELVLQSQHIDQRRADFLMKLLAELHHQIKVYQLSTMIGLLG